MQTFPNITVRSYRHAQLTQSGSDRFFNKTLRKVMVDVHENLGAADLEQQVADPDLLRTKAVQLAHTMHYLKGVDGMRFAGIPMTGRQAVTVGSVLAYIMVFAMSNYHLWEPGAEP